MSPRALQPAMSTPTSSLRALNMASSDTAIKWLALSLDISQSEASSSLSTLTNDYKTLLKSKLPSIHASSSSDPLAASIDPLSERRSSHNEKVDEWSKFYEANELMNEVGIDLERLYLNNVEPEYFQGPEGEPRLEALRNVLFLVCIQLDSEVGYRQGMHELCGIVWYALQSSSSLTPLQLESSTYYISRHLIDSVLNLFDPRPVDPNAKYKLGCPPPKTKPVNCCEIMFEKLKKADGRVHEAIVRAGVPPQLFLLKWCRLIFCREFAAQDAILILDGVMTHMSSSAPDSSGLPSMLGSVAAAMVIMIRGTILNARDMNDILEALMRYKFPGGGVIEDGKYSVVGKDRVERMMGIARDVCDGAAPDLTSRSVSAPAPAPPPVQAIAQGAGNVLDALTKTSTNIMSQLAETGSNLKSNLENTSRPAWLMGGGAEEERQGGGKKVGGGDPGGDPFGLEDVDIDSTTPAPVKEKKIKAKKSTAKSTLDFLTEGMETKRPARSDVFGTFDDSDEEEGGEEEGGDDGGLFGAPKASSVFAPDPPAPAVVPAPAVIPAPAPVAAPVAKASSGGLFDDDDDDDEDDLFGSKLSLNSAPAPAPAPPSVPAPAPVPTTSINTNSLHANTLAASVKVLQNYLQDEGAGAPRGVWEALEKIEGVSKRLKD
ncbi:hypothetical protein TL16_g08251 [Triparma laevis f. inornata]|uniref:Rab-GAP TBC domain-containing protein n=1 Tax=Triparma laevis f. inornata TaxID=1714386 RepID=A0A9W7EJZ7_9STRA|nr:hypothetical protein TL16_g08251 [Triparma laevis f. inornata]